MGTILIFAAKMGLARLNPLKQTILRREFRLEQGDWPRRPWTPICLAAVPRRPRLDSSEWEVANVLAYFAAATESDPPGDAAPEVNRKAPQESTSPGDRLVWTPRREFLPIKRFIAPAVTRWATIVRTATNRPARRRIWRKWGDESSPTISADGWPDPSRYLLGIPFFQSRTPFMAFWRFVAYTGAVVGPMLFSGFGCSREVSAPAARSTQASSRDHTAGHRIRHSRRQRRRNFGQGGCEDVAATIRACG